jgi:methionyl aminopeptidase
MCIETAQDMHGLLRIGRIVALTLQEMEAHLRPGMTTKQLDLIGAKVLRQHQARSAPILTYKFPGTTCISINEEAAHGIPGKRIIQPGDVVKIDVSAARNGYFADAAITVLVPPVRAEHQRLYTCAQAAFAAAAAAARANTPVNEVGRAAEQTTRRCGYSVIHALPGHGVGRALHEWPTVPTVYRRTARERLPEGQVITIEPHIALGAGGMVTAADNWTLKTQDGSITAAYEHTIIVTKQQPILVTAR